MGLHDAEVSGQFRPKARSPGLQLSRDIQLLWRNQLAVRSGFLRSHFYFLEFFPFTGTTFIRSWYINEKRSHLLSIHSGLDPHSM